MVNDGQAATYMAHDGQTYQWPPPPGFWQASDGRWYPPQNSHGTAAPQPGKGINKWLVMLIPLAIVVGLAALGSTADDVDRSQRNGSASAPRVDFAEVASNYRGMGCDGEGTSLRLQVTVRGGDPEDCVLGALVAFDVMGIPKPDPTSAGGDLLDILGTYHGDDYQATVSWSSHLDGVTFVFTRR